eukprot:2607372-Lingulodinium_polyedra.AAC.1
MAQFEEEFAKKQKELARPGGSGDRPRTAKRQKTSARTEMLPVPSRFTAEELQRLSPANSWIVFVDARCNRFQFRHKTWKWMAMSRSWMRYGQKGAAVALLQWAWKKSVGLGDVVAAPAEAWFMASEF